MRKLLFFYMILLSFSVKAFLPAKRFEVARVWGEPIIKYTVDSSCPKGAPFRRKQENTDILEGPCISCEIPEEIELVDPEDCDRVCPNRTANFINKPLGFCVLKKCPSDKPFYEEIFGEAGCKNCQDEPKHIKEDECKQCSNMHWIEFEDHREKEKIGYCVPNKKNKIYHSMHLLTKEGYIMGISGGSAPFESDCDNPHVKNWGAIAVETSPEECAKCSNTHMNNGWCYFK